MGNLSMMDVIVAGSKTPDPDYHPVRDMPVCRWRGAHRYELVQYLPSEAPGTVRRLERCMECKVHTRVIVRRVS